MYRFWSSGSRGCDKTADATHLDLDCAKPIAPGATDITVPSPKRSRPVSVDTQCAHAPSKRVKTEHVGELLSPVSVADGDDATVSRKPSGAVDLERAREVIQYQFGLEILLKHDELRLIDQELAKCQVALEQLRRCHLMPYPTHCPTPSQMLEISSGKGPVLQAKPGHPVPKWAPPFGVVEGPYARHYAKWLIPDPAFDGIQPQARVPTEATRSRNVQVEGRTTRNSMPDVGAVGKPRSGRGAGQRLQALSSGYPQPKDKQAPCVLKRSDGATVKLVCIDCHRWDFSSTQGFINHCRIAHRRDFKSHEEAAVHCGHPIEVDETGGIVGDDSKPAAAAAAVAPASAAPIPAGLVHPLVRDQDMTEQHAYKALASRIRASLVLYHAGKLPGVGEIPTAPAAAPSKLVESSETPFLAQLMRKKNRGGNLDERVEDAKTKVDWDAAYQTEDDDREPTPSEETLDHSLSAARTPAGVMRVPARSGVAPPRQEPSTAPPISNSRFPTDASQLDFSDLPLFDVDDDDMMDVDLSPNTITSNNAPSLVSDSSDEAESSSSDDAASEDDDDNESVSDVAEIKVDEDHEAVMHRRSSSSGTGKKDEPKHVTFVGPLSSGGGGKGRRKQTATQKMRVA